MIPSLDNIFRRVLPRGFVASDEFLQILQAYRTLWLKGRFGGGKTSMAFILAAWLRAQGFVETIHSNVKSPLVTPVTVPLHDAALVLDEAWQILTTNKSVQDYAGFVRHLNLYPLMPSVYPPHARLRMLSCQRTINWQIAGIPMWQYQWQLGSGAIKERGKFFFFYPQIIFRLYAQGIIGGDGGIAAALGGTYGYYRKSQLAEQAAIEQDIARQIAALDGRGASTPQGDAGRMEQRNIDPPARTSGSGIQIDSSEIEAVLSDAASDITDAAGEIKRAARRR